MVNYDSEEFQKARDDIIHYENLVWTIAGTIVLLSLWVLYTIHTKENLEKGVENILMVFGFILSLYALVSITALDQKIKISRKVVKKISKDYWKKIKYLKIGNYPIFFILGMILGFYMYPIYKTFGRIGIILSTGIFILILIIILRSYNQMYSSLKKI